MLFILSDAPKNGGKVYMLSARHHSSKSSAFDRWPRLDAPPRLTSWLACDRILDAQSKSGSRPPLSRFYVYILRLSKGGQLYIGFTTDLKRRMTEHLKKQSLYTSTRGLSKLIYYEAYIDESDARARERLLKQFKSTYGHLKKRISGSIEI